MMKVNILQEVTEIIEKGAKVWMNKYYSYNEKDDNIHREVPPYINGKEWIRHNRAAVSAGHGFRMDDNEDCLFLLDVMMNDFQKDSSYPRAQEIWLYCRTFNIIVPEEIDEIIATRFAQQYCDWKKPGQDETWLEGVSKDGYDIFHAIITEQSKRNWKCSDGKAISIVYKRLNHAAKVDIETEEAFEKKARRALKSFLKSGYQVSLTSHKVSDFGQGQQTGKENYFSRMTGGDDLGYGLNI